LPLVSAHEDTLFVFAIGQMARFTQMGGHKKRQPPVFRGLLVSFGGLVLALI
jgi:hypothetical protein